MWECERAKKRKRKALEAKRSYAQRTLWLGDLMLRHWEEGIKKWQTKIGCCYKRQGRELVGCGPDGVAARVPHGGGVPW